MKPIYQISIDTNLCNYELWLNDFKIDFQSYDHPMYFDLPVNHGLVKGENSLKMIMKPINDTENLHDNAYCKLKVIKSELSGNEELIGREEILVFNSDKISDIKKTTNGILPVYTKATVFTSAMDSIFSKFNLMKLDVDFEMIQKLYYELHTLFRNKDEDTLLALIKPKIELYSYAYHDTTESEKLQARMILDDLFSKKVEALDFEKCTIRYYRDKRLVCIEALDGDQPLYFTDNIDSGLVYYPVYWGMQERSKDWKIYL